MPETTIKVGNVYRYAPKDWHNRLPAIPTLAHGEMLRIVAALPGRVTTAGHVWAAHAMTGAFIGLVAVSDLIEVA